MRVYTKAHLDMYAQEAAAYWSAFWETMHFHVVQIPSYRDVFPGFLHPGQRAIEVHMNKVGITVLSYFADAWSVKKRWHSSVEMTVAPSITIGMGSGDPIDVTMMGAVQNDATGAPTGPSLPWHMIRSVAQPDHATFDTAEAVAYAKDVALYFTTQHLLGLDAGGTPDDVIERIRHLVDEFEEILASAEREEDVQRFLTDNPALLDLRAVRITPKLKLGSDYVTDYVIELPGHEYILVEIEAASRKLYTGQNNPTADMSHAVQQVEDWVEWAYENRSYLASKLPNVHEPQGLVIMGRRSTLTEAASKALKRRNRMSKIAVRTFDDLAADARAVADNIASIKPSPSRSAPSAE